MPRGTENGFYPEFLVGFVNIINGDQVFLWCCVVAKSDAISAESAGIAHKHSSKRNTRPVGGRILSLAKG